MKTNRVTLITGTIPGASDHPPDGPYQELAAAIVHQAIVDYVKAQQGLWNSDLSVAEKRKLILEITELEEFFHSQWYEFLINTDPNKLIAQCRVVAKEKAKRARERANKAAIKKMMNENKERLSGENPEAFSNTEKQEKRGDNNEQE